MSDTRAPEMEQQEIVDPESRHSVAVADQEGLSAEAGSTGAGSTGAGSTGAGSTGAGSTGAEEEVAVGRGPRSRRSSRADADQASLASADGSDPQVAPTGAASPADVDQSAEGAVEGDTAMAAEAGGPAGQGGSRRTASLRRLEEEGEVAADYLEELLDIVDLDGDIDIDVENGRASVAIVTEPAAERDLRRLVGGNAEVLEALQELARLAVQARTGERSRLMLDIVGHRAGRRKALAALAERACEEVARTGTPKRLEPMSAFERKVVHDVVAEAGLVSESEGEEPNRRVVVHPAEE